jgi:hypothetical protein
MFFDVIADRFWQFAIEALFLPGVDLKGVKNREKLFFLLKETMTINFFNFPTLQILCSLI